MNISAVTIQRIDYGSPVEVDPSLYREAAIGDLIEIGFTVNITTVGATLIGSKFEFNARLFGFIDDSTNFDGGYVKQNVSLNDYLLNIDLAPVYCGANYLLDMNPHVYIVPLDYPAGKIFGVRMRFIMTADTNLFQDCNNFPHNDRLTKNNFLNAAQFDNSTNSVYSQDRFISSIFRITDNADPAVWTLDLGHEQQVTGAFWDKLLYNNAPAWNVEITSNAPNENQLEIFVDSEIEARVTGLTGGGDPDTTLLDAFIGMIALDDLTTNEFQIDTKYSYVDATVAAVYTDWSDYVRGLPNKFFVTPLGGLQTVSADEMFVDCTIDGCELVAGNRYLFWALFHRNDTEFRYTGNYMQPVGNDANNMEGGCWDTVNQVYWLANDQNNRIDKYDADWNWISSFSTNAEDTNPMSVCTDGVDLWVVGRQNDNVYKYSFLGVYSGFSFNVAVEAGNLPKGITFDGLDLWVLSDTNNAIYKYNVAGVYSGTTWSTAPYNNPIDCDFDGTDFWITQDSNAATTGFRRYSPTGTLLESVITFPLTNTLGGGFNSVWMIIWNTDTNSMWISTGNGNLDYFPHAAVALEYKREKVPAVLSSKIFTASTSNVPTGCFPTTTSSFIDYTKTWIGGIGMNDHIITSVQDRLRATYSYDKASYNACVALHGYTGQFDDYLDRIEIDIYDKSTDERLETFSLDWDNGAFPDVSPFTTSINNAATLEVLYDFRIRHDDTVSLNNWAGREINMDVSLIFKYEDVVPNCSDSIITYEDVQRYRKQIDVRGYDNFEATPIITDITLAGDGLINSWVCSGVSVIQVCAICVAGYDTMAFIDDGYNWLALQEQEDYVSPVVTNPLLNLSSRLLSNITPTTALGSACFDVSAPLLNENNTYRVSMICKFT